MMATQTAAPRSARSGPPIPTGKFSIADITGKGSGLPNRTVLHGVEGWGKTSFAAQTVKPIFLETKGETGLETLVDNGRLPEVPHFPELQTWSDVLAAIDFLSVGEHNFRTLALDTLNGAERLCHEHVCARDFGGDWTEKGFIGYQRGPEVALADWREFLAKLDTLRATRRMAIMLLCHTKVQTFKNPEGPDYDRYQPDCNTKTWSLTHKWADVVLFGNYEVTIVGGSTGDNAKKGKGKGGQRRMLYTERHASYDAKNRLGLPEEVEMGNSSAEAWANFLKALKTEKEQAQ